MARPLKQGIDYFPLDTDLEDSFKLLEATFGTNGVKAFAIVIKLYQKAYKENGYFYPWSEDDQLLFSREVNVDRNEVSAYINEAVKRGIFDQEKFEMGIITSRGIQKRFVEATKRRMELTIYKDIWIVNVNIIPVNVNNNPRAVEFLLYSGTHSARVREIKTKESKDIEKGERASARDEPSPTPAPPPPLSEPEPQEKGNYGTFENVHLTSDEYSMLLTRYGQDAADGYIERLGAELRKKKSYPDHCAQIVKWMAQDGIKPKSVLAPGETSTYKPEPFNIADLDPEQATALAAKFREKHGIPA